MIILYILLVAYILAINFYAFVLVKSFRDKEREAEVYRQASPLAQYAIPNEKHESESASLSSQPVNHGVDSLPQGATDSQPTQKTLSKLLITGALGGAIAIYVCMFIFKYKRTELLLMVVMPLLGVLNVYIWVLLFRSGFFIVR